MAISPADQVSVYDHRVIRPQPGLSAWRVSVFFSPFLVDSIVIDHGIHVSGRNDKSQTGFPENIDAFRISPVRLGDKSHRIAAAFQQPGDDGAAKGGVIHVGVAADIDEIRLGDISGFQFFFRNR